MAYFVLVLVMFQKLSNSALDKAGRELAEVTVEASQALSDYASGFREIRVLSRSEFFLQRLSAARRRVAEAQATDLFLQSIPRLLVETALVLGTIGFLGWELASPDSGENFAVVGLMCSLRITSALLPLQRSAAALRFFAPQAQAALELPEGIEERRRAQITVISDKLEPNGDHLFPNGLQLCAVHLEFG